MIVGLGMDVVELDRIEAVWRRHGDRFLDKVLTAGERAVLPSGASGRRVVEFLAARFAAKEAGSKALGTGFRQGVSLHTIAVRHLESGKPEIDFIGPALDRFHELGAARALVTLTHGRDVAAATVVLETD